MKKLSTLLVCLVALSTAFYSCTKESVENSDSLDDSVNGLSKIEIAEQNFFNFVHDEVFCLEPGEKIEYEFDENGYPIFPIYKGFSSKKDFENKFKSMVPENIEEEFTESYEVYIVNDETFELNCEELYICSIYSSNEIEVVMIFWRLNRNSEDDHIPAIHFTCPISE